MNVTVIGLGAMGGGMARSLLRCPSVNKVSGYDLSLDLVIKFYEEAASVNKAAVAKPSQPFQLSNFVSKEETDVTIIVLVNEIQCNQVCFGSGGKNNKSENNNTLFHLMKPDSCVILCSTVTPAFAKLAYEKFASKNIRFVDCPMSGGPVRALAGELTMMVAAGEEKTLSYVNPLLDAMGKEIHRIPGGPGMGSTVKMVHQLLAGVHIVVAAEALALAAKAGLDVEQMYDIVKGAAGSSWMFCDRGKRMFSSQEKVMSALQIFIKDLDIVYSESKRLQCPTPIASAALQQFISGASMGLSKQDDSQVVKVYESITGVPVTTTKKRENGNNNINNNKRQKTSSSSYINNKVEEGNDVGKEFSKNLNVTVIGLGAMGGGMARSLLRCPYVNKVSGYDLSLDLVTKFHEEAAAVNKATATKPPQQQQPIQLSNFVSKEETDVTIIVLVNETQCNQVCFGSGDQSLINLMKPNSCIILCSTVTPAFAKLAYEKFASKNIQFVDCPMSGGPVRALAGELTMMVAGEEKTLSSVNPLLDAMGKEIHIIPGGPGMGSTVKMVHQLLAGVHIVVAAEALALAAKAGLNVEQMYDIVKGAAGSSWMFCDRGKRMFDSPDKVMSALQIFIKDLDIVYSESKRLQCPTPIASAALQQFISGASMGLSKQDDSQVVKVYETITGIPVTTKKENGHSNNNSNKRLKSSADEKKVEGDNVGDLWEGEEILEVGDEPRHKLVLSNDYTRVLKVKFPPNDTTLVHRHAEDSLYFFLVEGGLDVINHVQGYDPQCDCMGFGEVRFGTHKSDKPLVHRITNKASVEMFCIDAEVIKSPPITCPLPLIAPHHTLIKTREKCRVYKLELEPNESTEVSYTFFHLSIVLKGGVTVTTKVGSNSVNSSAKKEHSISWEKMVEKGDLEWCTPTLNLTITNKGPTKYEQYIAEWR